jgi:hypothetical protein
MEIEHVIGIALSVVGLLGARRYDDRIRTTVTKVSETVRRKIRKDELH